MTPYGKRLKRNCSSNTSVPSQHQPTSNSNLVSQLASTMPYQHQPTSNSSLVSPLVSTVSPQHQPTSNSSLVSQSASADEGGQNNIQHGPTPASNIDSTKQKKGRGLTTGKLIEKMICANENKPLEIVFPEGCRKPVQYASQLTSAVGYVVRHLSLLKDIRTYDEIPEERKECLYGGLMIEQDEWRSMCDWFEDPDFKKISATNAKNSTMLPCPHTGGSKSNHIRAREMVPPSPIDAWTTVHKRNGGSFVNDT
ncbi:hypothetical protein ACH5RR_001763 [Cinchona calisaya]|uniref:Uncharacterized protein n=1 Tax=Cinchona calisaya TaxID=153742 RepID=A0ABD3B4C4_9GENT